MKIVKSVLMLSLITGVINAKEPLLSSKYPIVNAYEGQYRGNRTFAENKNFVQSECFKRANEYIYNPMLQKNIKLTIGDPNTPKNQKIIKSKTPDYVSALNTLVKCAKDTNNPIAAWESVKIIISFLGINYKTNVAKYKEMSKMLYKDKSCDGYMNWGNIYIKGIAEKPDKQKAMKIFQEGQKLCKSSWYKVVFEMKLDNLKYQK